MIRYNQSNSSSLIKIFLAIVVYLSFFYPVLLGADTLPPLPLEELKKLNIKFQDTLLPFSLSDTFTLQVSVGNILASSLLFSKAIFSKSHLKIFALADKNYDYTNYLKLNGSIDYGWLTKNSWQNLSVGLTDNLRYYLSRLDTKSAYQNISVMYHPIWFIKNIYFDIKQTIRLSRYLNVEDKNYLGNNLILKINHPTWLGNLTYQTDLLYQTTKKLNFDNNLSCNLNLSHLFLLTPRFFIQPALSYYLPEKQIGEKVNFGILLNNIKTLFNIQHNTVIPYYFDTLYTNVFPYRFETSSLKYLQADYTITVSIIWHHNSIKGSLAQYNCYLTLQSSNDSLLYQTIPSKLRTVEFAMDNKFYGIKNNLIINYPFGNFFITPNFNLTDSLSYQLKKMLISLSYHYVAKRTLPSYSVFSFNFDYHYKNINLKTAIENIFNNHYYLTPTNTHKGRKYYLAVSFNIII